MPYPNEHAARQSSPGLWQTYSRLAPEGWPAGVEMIRGCRREGDETVCGIQSIRFDRQRWTVREADAWLRRNGYRPVNEPAA